MRNEAQVPWRVYPPRSSSGTRRTGVMDKIDGPYYFFKAIQKARFALPEWFPLIGPEMGYTNMCRRLRGRRPGHIAHQPGMNFQAST